MGASSNLLGRSVTRDMLGGWVRLQICLAGALPEICLVGGCVFKTAWQEHYLRCVWWVAASSKLLGRSISRDVLGGWMCLENCLTEALPKGAWWVDVSRKLPNRSITKGCLVGGFVFMS